MCGIVGFAGSDPELLEQMLRSIVHRGPDGQGTDIGTHFSIGMRRLAIIDVATGDQPLYSDDRNLALVFNGEIYNHAELRRELERRGRRFVTDHSDTEVILRGFEEWGRNVVDHLTGMFAFAISDHERGELFLARDRLGIKPLYYVDGPDGFAFASELKALFQDARVARRPDVDALRRFLLFRAARRRRGHLLRRREAPAPRAHDARPARRHREDRALLEPAGEPGVRVEPQRRRLRAGVREPLGRGRASAISSPTCPSACRSRAVSTRAASSSTMARLMSSGTDLHTAGPLHVLRAVSGREHRRERVHPRGRARGRQHPALRVPAARRLLERDRRVDLVPGGTDDRVGAVRVLLRVPARESST